MPAESPIGQKQLTQLLPGSLWTVDHPQATESDTNSSLVTTFTVTPQDAASRVRISTTWQGARGIGGLFERLFTPRVMRGIYTDELKRLNTYARQRAASAIPDPTRSVSVVAVLLGGGPPGSAPVTAT